MTGLRGEYAEPRKKYDLIFRFSLKTEYPRAYKWNLIEYPRIFNEIPFMGLPQEYPYSYSPRRVRGLRSESVFKCPCAAATRIRMPYFARLTLCINLVYAMDTYIFKVLVFIDGSYTKGTRAHTHKEMIREWLWEPKGSSLEYI